MAGRGHAGKVDTVEYARQVLGTEPAYALIGGLHLSAASNRHWPGPLPGCIRSNWAICSARPAPDRSRLRLRELAALDRKRA